MALTPTEREEHFFKAMVDAADGSTPEELEPTERKEHWYKEIIDAIKVGGGGSGGGVLVVNAEYDGESTYTLDKTWQECKDAELVSVTMEGFNTFCIGVTEFDNILTHQTEYSVLVYDFKNESPVEFKTATA